MKRLTLTVLLLSNILLFGGISPDEDYIELYNSFSTLHYKIKQMLEDKVEFYFAKFSEEEGVYICFFCKKDKKFQCIPLDFYLNVS